MNHLSIFLSLFVCLCSRARLGEQVCVAPTVIPVPPRCGGETQRASLSAMPAACTWNCTGWVRDSVHISSWGFLCVCVNVYKCASLHNHRSYLCFIRIYSVYSKNKDQHILGITCSVFYKWYALILLQSASFIFYHQNKLLIKLNI